MSLVRKLFCAAGAFGLVAAFAGVVTATDLGLLIDVDGTAYLYNSTDSPIVVRWLPDLVGDEDLRTLGVD